MSANYFKLVSVGFLVLWSLWRNVNKSTFWDISFLSVFLPQTSSTLLESRHSHNISCPIFGKKVAVEMKMECFEFEERLKRLCLNLYMVRSLSTEKSSAFFWKRHPRIAERALCEHWGTRPWPPDLVINVWPWASPGLQSSVFYLPGIVLSHVTTQQGKLRRYFPLMEIIVSLMTTNTYTKTGVKKKRSKSFWLAI